MLQKMHIGVVGLGNFGSSLALQLYKMGHQVTALDIRKRSLIQVQDYVDQAVAADATDRSILVELGLNLADVVVISLGNNMAGSILVTLHFKEMELKRIIAKAVGVEHEKILKKVGATEVIFPEREVAERLATSLVHPNFLDYLPLGKDFSLAEVEPPSEWIGKTLVEVNLRRKYQVNVIAIREQNSEQMSIIIEPHYKIRETDILVVLGQRHDIQCLPTVK